MYWNQPRQNLNFIYILVNWLVFVCRCHRTKSKHLLCSVHSVVGIGGLSVRVGGGWIRH